MLNQKYTREFHSEHRPIETGALIADEGIALVFVKEGSDTVVRPANGVAGEIFAGVSKSRNVAPLFVPFVFEGTVDSASGLELPRLPLAGQTLVRIEGAAATIVGGAPAAAGEVQIDGQQVNYHADDDGKSQTVQFMYEPTVTEARTFKGDVAIGGLSSTAQGIIGLITKGDIATTYFDASADFTGALEVNLGADGKFTVGGSGVKVPGVTVQSAPSADNPCLVLRIA